MDNKTTWCDNGWMPFAYGFCPSEKAWNKTLRKLKIKSEPYPEGIGKCTTFENGDGELFILVTINPRENTSDPTIIAVLVHEAVHVKQYLMRHIGEHTPSDEFEAYSIQNIFANLFDAYAKSR